MRALLLAFAVGGAAVVGTAAPAAAHTHVEGSQPADGAVLDSAPEQVVIDFSERLEATRSTAQLTSEGRPTRGIAAALDPQDPSRLVLTLPAELASGVHRVTYRAYGADDLHEVSGSIVFGVGVTPASAGGEAASTARPAEVLARAAAGLGFAVVAAALIVLWALPRRRPAVPEWREADRAVRMATLAGLLALVVGTGAALVDHAVAVGGPFPETLWQVISSTGPGRRAVLAVEAVAIVGVLVAASRPGARHGHAVRLPLAMRGRPTPAELGSAVAVLGLAAVLAAGGHGGTGAPPVADAALLVLHVLTSGMWVGSLVLLPIVVRTTGLGWSATVRALAPVAEGLVLVTVSTGLVLAAGRMRTVTALLAPGYGWIVLAKIAVVPAAVVLGVAMLRHATRTSRAPGRIRPAEIAVACALVGLGAWLTATPPATGPEFQPEPADPPTAWSGQADDLAVRLTFAPNHPGTNFATVDVHDTRRPAPGRITAVSLSGVELDEPIGAEPAGDGRWDLGSISLGAGDTRLDITVARSGLPDARASVTWTVPPVPMPRHRTIISTARLRPGLDLATLAGAVAVALMLRRRHHHPEGSDDRHRHLAAAAPTAAPAPSRARDLDRHGHRPGSRAGPRLVRR